MKTYKSNFIIRLFLVFACALVLNACNNEDESVDSTTDELTSVSFTVSESLEESTVRTLAEPQSFQKNLGNGLVLQGKIIDEGAACSSKTKTTSAITDGTTVYAVICNSSNVVYDLSVLSVSSGALTISVPSGVASIIYFYIGSSCPSVSIGETITSTSASISETTDDDPMMSSATITAAQSASAGDNLGTLTFHHYIAKVYMKMYVPGTRDVDTFTAALQDVSCAATESVYPFADPSTTTAAYTTTGTAVDLSLVGATEESDSLVSNTVSFFSKVNSTTTQTAVLDFSEISVDGSSLTLSQDVNDTLHLIHAFQASHKYKIVASVSTVIPEGVTVESDQYHLLASVYDEDYLPYTVPTATATSSVVAADGTAEDEALDYQGTITTTGKTIYIPITATESATLYAYSTSATVSSSMTEDATSRDVTLSWEDQAITSSSTYITATLKSVGGTLNAKQLDVNAGIGSDCSGILMTTFSIPYNCDGDMTDYELRDISCIPDKMYGQYTYTETDNVYETEYQHQFLYVPVVAKDGNFWLNNNLGADYANLNKSCCDPAQQAIACTDYHAYGSLFQWGRSPDGHELMTWTSSTSGTTVYGTCTTRADVPVNSLYISTSESDWRVNQDDDLWASESSTNNPCPDGFRVPTFNELYFWSQNEGINTTDAAAAGYSDCYGMLLSSSLAISLCGKRSGTSFSYVGVCGWYWTSQTAETINARFISFAGGNPDNFSTARGNVANGVRCVQD